MSILVVYTAQPNFPPTDQQLGAARVQIGNLWVDYTGAVPVQADVDVVFAPGIAAQQRVASFAADANVQALLTQASTATTAQIDGWLVSNVTTLAQARTVLGALIKVVAAKLI